MNVEPHDLPHEFPEYAAAILRLRSGDAHFAALFEKYDNVSNELRNIEEHDVPISDVLFEDMKKERFILKDALYQILRGQKPA
jgi:uncharacterized protein YdcH (DUF465 family)